MNDVEALRDRVAGLELEVAVLLADIKSLHWNWVTNADGRLGPQSPPNPWVKKTARVQ